ADDRQRSRLVKPTWSCINGSICERLQSATPLLDRTSAMDSPTHFACVAGNAGDVPPAGNGLSELRIKHRPGYRACFVRRGTVLIVLLSGGNKSSRDRDITKAKEMATDLDTWHGHEGLPV
ncbi:MAG: type II toxin-antitoxin system RelE/ParE family toxin, partial [Acetobacteraceae bacterium]